MIDHVFARKVLRAGWIISAATLGIVLYGLGLLHW
jgi:hypothetical protein